MSALFVWATVSLPALGETVHVARVLDGDSLRLEDGRDVRLIGANAPEVGRDGVAEQPLAREARQRLEQLVSQSGNKVRLEFDRERHDRYKRTLAYVFLSDGRRAEDVLLRAGLAFAVAVAPNVTQIDSLLAAEKEARAAKRGVWGDTYYLPRAATALTPEQAGFRLVSGTVRRIGHSRTSIYLDLAENVSVAVPREHWHYLGGDPKRFVGRALMARGWVAVHGKRMHLQLSHPAMLELVN